MGTFGGYYFILDPLVLFMILVGELAREKEFRLRQGLNVVGVSHIVYWINWFVIGTLLNILQVSVLIITGFLFGFELWQNTESSVLFYVFFMTGQQFAILAFLVSTFTKTME